MQLKQNLFDKFYILIFLLFYNFFILSSDNIVIKSDYSEFNSDIKILIYSINVNIIKHKQIIFLNSIYLKKNNTKIVLEEVIFSSNPILFIKKINKIIFLNLNFFYFFPNLGNINYKNKFLIKNIYNNKIVI